MESSLECRKMDETVYIHRCYPTRPAKVSELARLGWPHPSEPGPGGLLARQPTINNQQPTANALPYLTLPYLSSYLLPYLLPYLTLPFTLPFTLPYLLPYLTLPYLTLPFFTLYSTLL